MRPAGTLFTRLEIPVGWTIYRRASLLVALLMSSVLMTHVLAETADAKPAPLWGYLSIAPLIEANKDLHALAPGSLSVGQAVAAFDRGGTGLVIEIGVSRDGGGAFYAATIDDSNGLRFVRVSSLTGSARAADHPVGNRAQLDAQNLRTLAEISSPKITLPQAITIAEKFSGNRLPLASSNCTASRNTTSRPPSLLSLAVRWWSAQKPVAPKSR
jgi:hypothetical protein